MNKQDLNELIKQEQIKILREQFSGHFDSVIDEAIIEVMNEQELDNNEEINNISTQEEELGETPNNNGSESTDGETSDIIDFLRGEHRDEFRGQIVRKLSKKVKGQTVNFTFIGDFDKDYQEMQTQIQDELSREKYRLFSNSIVVFSYTNRHTKEKEQVWFMPVRLI